jgi:hypothetical protein
MEKTITRRNFLQGAILSTLGLAVGLKANPLQPFTPKKTKVVLIRHKDVFNESKVNADIIAKMIDEAVMTLTNQKDPVKAFAKLIKPSDIVGIKTNAQKMVPTPQELENAVKTRLMDVGVKEENIGIDDRGVLRNPVFQKSTALINMRATQTHYWAGLGTCIKNYIMFAQKPSIYHPDSCADLALAWKLPIVKDKTRLNILVVLKPLFYGRGPHHFDNRYVWNYNGLIVGTDPVAVDTIALELIKAKRIEYFGNEGEWETQPKHIAYADTRHKLGTSDLNKIELIKLGWDEGILI